MQGVAIPITMVAGNSWMHRINPLPKLLFALGILIFSFATRNPMLLGTVFAVGVFLALTSGIWAQYFKIVQIFFPISLTLITLQSIAPAFPLPWTAIATYGPFTIYQEGIYSGLSMLLRIYCMTTFALVVIMTSHPSDMFVSLQKIGMPYVLNFIFTMTLQLIPILQNEFSTVLSAQKSRGMKGSGFGALLPSMVPVFVGAIERVQQLSISLESRAFGSSGTKTSYRNVTFAFKDYLVGVVGVLITGGLTAWVLLDPSLDWSRTLQFAPEVALGIVLLSTVGFLAFFVVAIFYIVRA